MTERKLTMGAFILVAILMLVIVFSTFIILNSINRRDVGIGFSQDLFSAPEDLNRPRVVLQRPLGLFINMHDTEYVGLIGTGCFELEIIKQIEDWALVSGEPTRGESLWIDFGFYPPSNILSDFFKNYHYSDRISVYYHNLNTGFIFGHRDDVVYTSASLNKAAHALYVYHLIELGAIDSNQNHIFSQSELRPGTGVILNMPLGTEFTHLELLRHSVQDSDNIAFFILLNAHSERTPKYQEFYRRLGGDLDLLGNVSNHRMTAAEAALIMYHIYQYVQEDTYYSRHFHHSLLNSDVPIIQADYPVAQKYGHWRDAFHDMAIVHAPSPYILVILSDMGNIAPFYVFDEVSAFIQEFNNMYFVGN